MNEEKNHLHKNYDELYNLCLEQQKEIERLNKIVDGLKVAQKDYRVSQLKLINDFKRRYGLISSDPPTRHLLRCLLDNLNLYGCKFGILEILEESDKYE